MSVHKPLPHDAALLHVTGQARYIDDIPTPANTLHLAFGLSSIAKGTITALDLSDVLASEGVVDVLTSGQLPFANDVSPSAHDEPLLSDGDIHYLGQPIFLVIAESHLAARKAARLANVQYDEETAILTIEDALAANIRFEDGPRIYGQGDIATLDQAPIVLEDSFDIGAQEHFYLEGQAALAMPQEDGEMVVHSSTQHPTEIQHKVADAIGVGMHDVRVEVRRMGGGFGGKESQGNALACACAIAAQYTGQPCKMRYDRDDDMIITGKRHDFRIHYRVGCSQDGKILGVDFTHYARCGWAQDLSLPVADRAMLHADNAYYLPNIRIESHRLKTNTQSATAFRGFGGPQGMIGIERVMDHVAHRLKMDPLEVRRINYYSERAVDPVDASGESISSKLKMRQQTTPYGMPVEDFVLNALTQDLVVQSDYEQRRSDIHAWNERNQILKRGIAFSPVKFGISFTLTHLNQAGALVNIYQDGTVRLNHGGTEMGQGLFQKVAQVAAHSFGLGLDRIKITATDTAKVPNTSATAASSGSDLNGMAVKAACDTLKNRLIAFLSKRYSCVPSDISFANEHVYVKDQSQRFEDVIKAAYEHRISLSATGFYKTPKVAWDRIAGHGRPFLYFAYGASVSEVVIDTLTGEYRILRTDILHDVGKSLNPALDIGQIEGAYVQGTGWLTTEELVWDARGALKTHAPSTYKIPAFADRPAEFNVALWDTENTEDTIHKSKAVGEPPFMHGISTFLALSHAVSQCGPFYPHLNAPATPECVLRAIRMARHGV